MDGTRSYPEEPDGRRYPSDHGFGDRYEGDRYDGDRYEDERYRPPEQRYGEEATGRYADLAELSGDLGRREPRTDFEGFQPRSPVGPRSGVELPPVPTEQQDQRFHTEPIDRAALRRPVAPAAAAPEATGTVFGSPAGPIAGMAPPGMAPGMAPAGMAPPGMAPPGMAPPGMAPPGMATGIGPVPGMAPGPVSGPGPMPGMVSGPPAEPPGGAIYRTRRAGIAALLAAVAVVAELLLVRVLLAGELTSKVQPGAVLAGLFAMVGVPLATMGLYGLMTGAATAAGPTPARAWLRTPLAYLPVGLVLLLAAGLAAR